MRIMYQRQHDNAPATTYQDLQGEDWFEKHARISYPVAGSILFLIILFCLYLLFVKGPRKSYLPSCLRRKAEVREDSRVPSPVSKSRPQTSIDTNYDPCTRSPYIHTGSGSRSRSSSRTRTRTRSRSTLHISTTFDEEKTLSSPSSPPLLPPKPPAKARLSWSGSMKLVKSRSTSHIKTESSTSLLSTHDRLIPTLPSRAFTKTNTTPNHSVLVLSSTKRSTISSFGHSPPCSSLSSYDHTSGRGIASTATQLLPPPPRTSSVISPPNNAAHTLGSQGSRRGSLVRPGPVPLQLPPPARSTTYNEVLPSGKPRLSIITTPNRLFSEMGSPPGVSGTSSTPPFLEPFSFSSRGSNFRFSSYGSILTQADMQPIWQTHSNSNSSGSLPPNRKDPSGPKKENYEKELNPFSGSQNGGSGGGYLPAFEWENGTIGRAC